ncbi:hypothetical protein XENTR_v10011630 [Xenopus tropicalis]|nr:hypothetical protein XENTR_v10011630 [Xenopus tropicalis]
MAATHKLCVGSVLLSLKPQSAGIAATFSMDREYGPNPPERNIPTRAWPTGEGAGYRRRYQTFGFTSPPL